eukprot:7255806-Prymnesium_polylepis.1
MPQNLTATPPALNSPACAPNVALFQPQKGPRSAVGRRRGAEGAVVAQRHLPRQGGRGGLSHVVADQLVPGRRVGRCQSARSDQGGVRQAGAAVGHLVHLRVQRDWLGRARRDGDGSGVRRCAGLAQPARCARGAARRAHGRGPAAGGQGAGTALLQRWRRRGLVGRAASRSRDGRHSALDAVARHGRQGLHHRACAARRGRAARVRVPLVRHQRQGRGHRPHHGRDHPVQRPASARARPRPARPHGQGGERQAVRGGRRRRARVLARPRVLHRPRAAAGGGVPGGRPAVSHGLTLPSGGIFSRYPVRGICGYGGIWRDIVRYAEICPMRSIWPAMH